MKYNSAFSVSALNIKKRVAYKGTQCEVELEL